jgi:hypothetical protein
MLTGNLGSLWLRFKQQKKFEVENNQLSFGPLEQGKPVNEFKIIVLSFNEHGIRGTPKILALKRLCVVVNPNILLIQETMCRGAKADEVFSS